MANSGSFVDYYHLLGVATDAELAVIREAFLRLAKQHHPDRGGNTEVMQQYTTAYRTLKSTHSRKAYDLLHDFHTDGSARYLADNDAQSKQRPLSDKEIDDFIDTVFSEYRQAPKPRQTLLSRLRQLF